MNHYPPDEPEQGGRPARVALAGAFRLAARFGWNEAVANHFSLALPGGDFLINPQGRHWARMRASDIVRLDPRNPQAAIGNGPGKVDPTAWHIHATIHARVPGANCVLHTHMPWATALCCLRGFRLQMCEQNAMRFHERIAWDEDFAGMALDAAEGERLAAAMGDKPILFLVNHGVIVTAPTLARAFDEMYYLERACQTQVLALSTGRELAVVDEAVARLTCRQWMEYPAEAFEDHFRELMALLDEQEPAHAD